MAEEKRFAKATWQIMEQLLEVDNLDDALSGSSAVAIASSSASSLARSIDGWGS